MIDPDTTTIVVPTVGRPSLGTLLSTLGRQTVTPAEPVVIIDDRSGEPKPLAIPDDAPPVLVYRSGGRGVAAARNVGWRKTQTAWVSFLDDDVVPDDDWYELLLTDIKSSGPETVASQGRLTVPRPDDRKPTDWDRNTAILADARWNTADLTARRGALRVLGGFDERFERSRSADADFGLRLTEKLGLIVPGNRHVTHPVRQAGWWASVNEQAGNADDMLIRRLHGRRWRKRAAVPRGRRPLHLLVAGAGITAFGAAATRHTRMAMLGSAVWAAGTTELATSRIESGPATPAEVARMLTTSIALPFSATWHTARGIVRHRRALPWRGMPELVLFDRDGTLIEDVPFNGDPERVRLVPGAAEAVARVRSSGIPVGIITNQPGIARGLITSDQADAVNARVEELLGRFDVVEVCPHSDDDACECRAPHPGLVLQACQEIGADPSRTVLIGDTAADVGAAEAAGVTPVLVPNQATPPEETAPIMTRTLADAVDEILSGVR